MKAVTLMIAGIFLVFGLIIVVSSSVDRFNAQQQQKSDPCDSRSYAFLYALKQGDSAAAAFWKAGTKPQRLFSVRSFDLVKSGNFLPAKSKPYKVARVYYQYQVASSTEDGMPITKRWDIVLEPSSKDALGQPCAIVDLVNPGQ